MASHVRQGEFTLNIFVQKLAETVVDPAPDIRPQVLVVEDNVGESIHVHLRNLRLEMSIEDFETFADAIEIAQGQLDDGNR